MGSQSKGSLFRLLNNKLGGDKAMSYNGWTNYETWNVALYMDNDEQSYALARTCKNYEEYQFFNLTPPRNTTPDGVSLFDPKLNIKELDEKIQEYRQGHSPYTEYKAGA